MIGGFIAEEQILEVLNLYRIAFAAENFVAFDGSISYSAWNVYGGDLADALELSSLARCCIQCNFKTPNIFYHAPSLELE
jgi:hypothetical protein